MGSATSPVRHQGKLPAYQRSFLIPGAAGAPRLARGREISEPTSTLAHLRLWRLEQETPWPNLKMAVRRQCQDQLIKPIIGRSTQVKGMKEIIELARAGRLPPLDEPPPTA